LWGIAKDGAAFLTGRHETLLFLILIQILLNIHFHTLMSSFESQRFIKANGIGSLLIGGQLNLMGVFCLGTLNSPFKYAFDYKTHAVVFKSTR
jgi:hypothetical protein